MADNKTIEIVFSAVTDGLKKGIAEAVTGVKEVEKAAEEAGKKTSTAMADAGRTIESSTVPAAGRMAGALMGLINPANLAATAVTMLGTAIVAYATSGGEKIATLDEVMNRHAETIKRLGAAYPEAIKGLEAFARESNNVLQTRMQGDITSLQEKIRQMSETFSASISSTLPALDELSMRFGNVNAAGTTVKKGFEAFQGPIEAFNESIRRGAPDVDGFKRAIGDLAVQFKDDESVQKYANELLNLLGTLDSAAATFGRAAGAMRKFQDEMSGAADGMRTFQSTLKALEAVSPTKVDDYTRSQHTLTEALKNQNLTMADRDALIAKGEAAMQRAKDAEAARAKPAGAAPVDDGMSAQMARRMQFIIDSTLTEEQLLIAKYERNRLLLQEAFAIELADSTLQGEAKAVLKAQQDATIEALDAKHQQNMQRMQAATDARTLSNMSSTFGSIASIIESGGKKGSAAAKAFYIAQALMSTFSAATQAMADPTLITPFQKFAAYAAIATKGLASVASIVKAGGGGGGGGGAAAAGAGATTAAAPSPTTTFQFTMSNDPMGFGEKFARQFIDQLNSTQRNGGQIRGVIA